MASIVTSMAEPRESPARPGQSTLYSARAYGGAALHSGFAFARASLRSLAAFVDAGVQTVAAFGAARRASQGLPTDEPEGDDAEFTEPS